MKKIIYIAAALILAACSKQTTEPTKKNMEFSTLNGKTTLIGNTVVWEAGESISILDGESNNEFKNSKEGSTALFRGQAYDAATYYAVYPFNSENSVNGGIISTVIPSNQIARKDSFGSKANLSVAKTNNYTLEMKNVCGYLKMYINNDKTYKSVKVTAPGNEKISGPFNVSFDNAGNPVATAAQGAVNEVTLTAESGTLEAGAYYIALAPTTLSKGLELLLTDASGKTFNESLDYIDHVNRRQPLCIKGDSDVKISLELDIDFNTQTFSPELPTASSTTASSHAFTINGKTYNLKIRTAYFRSSYILFKGGDSSSTRGYLEFPKISGMALRKVHVYIKAHSSNHSINAVIADAEAAEYSGVFKWNETSAATDHEFILGESGKKPLANTSYRLLSLANVNCHINRVVLTYSE